MFERHLYLFKEWLFGADLDPCDLLWELRAREVSQRIKALFVVFNQTVDGETEVACIHVEHESRLFDFRHGDDVENTSEMRAQVPSSHIVDAGVLLTRHEDFAVLQPDAMVQEFSRTPTAHHQVERAVAWIAAPKEAAEVPKGGAEDDVVIGHARVRIQSSIIATIHIWLCVDRDPNKPRMNAV